MEFYQIRYLLAAADQLNFTKAAEICAVSQPALTVAIRKLEEELGGPLFLREHGRVTLTEFGRTMRTHLARIDEMRARAERTAREMLEEGGEEINLGIYSTIGPSFVGRGLTAFQASEPGTR
ncbi:MAG: LysR family transcriptional regulator, partial [Pseudomonadota bacterium]